ncbi:MAG: sialidase family protein, partial [Balneolales bacterium]
PESMAKMVFKPNGDIVAVYEVDTKSEINPYSGEIRYVYSTDNGVSWSNPSPVHQDTSSHKGRGFFDVELLANGEVGVAWLDATYPDGGRPLHFAQTTPENQFENEIMVENLACECCRVALESDAFGNIHLVFRNIDKIAEYEHIRDFAYSVSRDDGLTFSTPVIVSDDGWEFVGCPHTGAGFAVAGKNLHMAWYTMGGGSGLYYTSSSNSGQTFSERELISEHGRTPQVAVSNNGRVGMVWRESSGSNIQHSDHDGHNQSASKSTIMLQIRDGHTSKNTYLLSDGNSEVSFPVIHNNGDNYLIAWTERVNEAKKIKYKVFEP